MPTFLNHNGVTNVNNETKTTVSTKVQAFLTNEDKSFQLDAEGKKIPCPAVKTDLTIDWSGMSDEDVQALAQQALVVKAQSGWRSNGIPQAVTLKALEFKVGVRAAKAPPVTIESLIEATKSDPAKKAELIARLQAA